MHAFGKFLKKNGSVIEVSNGIASNTIVLKKDTIEKIKQIEEQTPPALKLK